MKISLFNPFLPTFVRSAIGAVAACGLALPLTVAHAQTTPVIETTFGTGFPNYDAPLDTLANDSRAFLDKNNYGYTDGNSDDQKSWTLENRTGKVIYRNNPNGNDVNGQVGGKTCMELQLPANRHTFRHYRLSGDTVDRVDKTNKVGRIELSYGFAFGTNIAELGDTGSVRRYRVDVFVPGSFAAGLTKYQASTSDPKYPVADIIQLFQDALDSSGRIIAGGQAAEWELTNYSNDAQGKTRYEVTLRCKNIIRNRVVISANNWYTIETIVYWNTANASGTSVPQGTNGDGGQENGYIRSRVYPTGSTPPAWVVASNISTMLTNQYFQSTEGVTPFNNKFVLKCGQYTGNFGSSGYNVLTPVARRSLYISHAAIYR